MTWFAWDRNNLLIRLHVQASARTPGIAGLHGDALKIKVAAAPRDGRANEEIIELLAKTCAVPASAVTILSGHRGRHKKVRIVAPSRFPKQPGSVDFQPVSNDAVKP